MWIGNWLIVYTRAETGSWCHTKANGEKTTYGLSFQKLTKEKEGLNAYQMVIGPFLVTIGKAV